MTQIDDSQGWRWYHLPANCDRPWLPRLRPDVPFRDSGYPACRDYWVYQGQVYCNPAAQKKDRSGLIRDEEHLIELGYRYRAMAQQQVSQ